MMENPLSEAMPAEVRLAHPPLIRMLTQLRFPAQPAFDERGGVEPILRALATTFPVVREEPFQGVVLRDPISTKSWTTWRVLDLEEKWRVSLSREFLAVETVSYQSHGDFIERFRRVLDAFPPELRPPVVDRFGLRYVNRLVEPALSQIPKLIRPEMLGVLSTPSAMKVRQSLSETLCDVAPHTLIARYGIVPANASYDPASLVPIPERSWLLDIDMYRERTRPFDIEELAQDAKLYAERIYTFFRWTVKDELLTYFNQYEK